MDATESLSVSVRFKFSCVCFELIFLFGPFWGYMFNVLRVLSFYFIICLFLFFLSFVCFEFCVKFDQSLLCSKLFMVLVGVF